MRSNASPHANLFGRVYEGRRVLVTGHTGFKGSWLVHWLRGLGAQVHTLALPAQTQPSHHEELARVLRDAPDALPAVASECLVDLSDATAVRNAVLAAQPEFVFHLAAQALVRPSYGDPVVTFATNVMGLIHVLEAVRACPSVRVMINVTTDKCYENVDTDEGYVESCKLGGHDPYSASKACAELVTASYRASFLGLNGRPGGQGGAVALATARAGNVIGGGDWAADRLVPDLMRAAAQGQVVPIRHPNATRPWQHVLEPLAAYLHLGHRLWVAPEAHVGAWNFGPDAQGHLSVGAMVERFADQWPAIRVMQDTQPQPHEARLLHLDCSHARDHLNWRPVWNTDTMVEATTRWYRRWYEAGEVLTPSQLDAFVRDASLAGLEWAT